MRRLHQPDISAPEVKTMLIKEILDRYPMWRDEYISLRWQIHTLRGNILDSSGSGSGERVQSSNIGDSTADKALRLVKKTEQLEERMAILEERIQLVTEALKTLSPDELNMVELYHFQNYSHSLIHQELGIPMRKIKNDLKSAYQLLNKLEEVILVQFTTN